MTVRRDPKEGEERGREREWRWSGECRRRGEGLGGKGGEGTGAKGRTERVREERGLFQRALVELTSFCRANGLEGERSFSTGFSRSNGDFQRALIEIRGSSTALVEPHTASARFIGKTTGLTY